MSAVESYAYHVMWRNITYDSLKNTLQNLYQTGKHKVHRQVMKTRHTTLEVFKRQLKFSVELFPYGDHGVKLSNIVRQTIPQLERGSVHHITVQMIFIGLWVNLRGCPFSPHWLCDLVIHDRNDK